ncbi:hypothetical protein JXR01_02465 [Candidatus Kaiserbacteria bacterium]|nr:MAG: hypothetical protein JXR01_02465 [Candidatus Kaiserbacteria bacterium]
MYKFCYISLIVLFLATATTASAATTAGLVNGLWFSTDPITNFGETTVYSVLHNQTDEQIQGIATLVVDGEAVKATEVTIGKGDIKRVGIPYAFGVGSHTIHMSFTAGNSSEITNTELAERTIFVVADTDGDGIQNTTDPDDDNDGINDSEDSEPLIKNILPKTSFDVTESGKVLLDKIVSRAPRTKLEEQSAPEDTEQEKEKGVVATTFESIENTRKKTAEVLREYEETQRAALAEIERSESLPAVEGFENEIKTAEESKKREHQIAAASASVAGVMISKAWMFYAELVVLTLGALHLLWVGLKRRFFRLGEEE